jgi:zinc D-Ala-D-Ala dipeptidase
LTKTNESEKRAYWARTMDASVEFMLKVRDVEIVDNREPLESLRSAAEDARVEVTFSDLPIACNMERQFYLRRGLIPKFVAVAKELNDQGWVLKVEDAYRTPLIQKQLQRTPDLFDAVLDIVLWETGGVLPDSEFVFRRLLGLIAFCPMVGTHISGSALDVSVFDRETGQDIDRGAPYIEFGVITPMDSPFISHGARLNRREITRIMKRHGFIDYPWEFWHYNQCDSYDVVLSEDPSRGVYGPVEWNPDTGAVTPVATPRERLNSDADIRDLMEAAMARRVAQENGGRTVS